MTINKVTLVMMTCQVFLLVTRARIGPVNDLPSWYPGSENKPAPMPLLRVQAFVNTRDLEDETDLLAEPGSARDWLLDAGLLEGEVEVSANEIGLVRDVREAMRSLIEVDGGPDSAAERLEPLRALAAGHRARLTVDDDGVVGLESAHHGRPDDGLFELLLIIRAAQVDGTWSRLRLCANPECQWAFYDRSRNQQGSWCSMAVCGNRLKNRELRARRR
jgi:predicted RNA-binding Zn ribbon-like protein